MKRWVCVCECPVNENRPKADSLLCRRCFAAKDVCALCLCNLLCMCNSPSFVLPGVSKCCVSPNCELSLLTTPPSSTVCCVKYTLCHGGQGNKGRHSLKLRYTGTLSLIDLAEENDFHIANNSNLQVGSYFYDRNSVTCTSEFRDPKQSRESTERALQHSVKFRNLPKAQRIVR